MSVDFQTILLAIKGLDLQRLRDVRDFVDDFIKTRVAEGDPKAKSIESVFLKNFESVNADALAKEEKKRADIQGGRRLPSWLFSSHGKVLIFTLERDEEWFILFNQKSGRIGFGYPYIESVKDLCKRAGGKWRSWSFAKKENGVDNVFRVLKCWTFDQIDNSIDVVVKAYPDVCQSEPDSKGNTKANYVSAWKEVVGYIVHLIKVANKDDGVMPSRSGDIIL